MSAVAPALPAAGQNDTLLILAALGIGAFVLISRQPKQVSKEPRPIAPKPKRPLPPVAPQAGQTVGQTTAVVTPPPPVPVVVDTRTPEQQKKAAQAAGRDAAAASQKAAEAAIARANAAKATVAPPKPVVIAPPAPVVIKSGAMSSTPAMFSLTASAPRAPAVLPPPQSPGSRVTMTFSKPMPGLRA